MHLTPKSAAVCVALCAAAPALMAEAMPPMPPEARTHWQAIGRVNGAGFRTVSGCTGALIAPDLVLTAAHCVNREKVGSTRHFVAGWDRGAFVAHEKSDTILVHPRYEPTNATARLRYDVALIRLPSPIDSELVTPLALRAGTRRAPRRADLFGYHNQRPHALSAHLSCDLVNAQTAPMWRFDCEVIAGNSGGPVIVVTDDGPKVAGVIVARSQEDGDAWVAPVDDWLLGHWFQALQRNKAGN